MTVRCAELVSYESPSQTNELLDRGVIPLSLSRFTSGFRASTSSRVIPLLLMMSPISSPERTG